MTWYLTFSWLDVNDFGVAWSSNRSKEEIGDLNLIQILVPGGSGKHPNGVEDRLIGQK